MTPSDQGTGQPSEEILESYYRGRVHHRVSPFGKGIDSSQMQFEDLEKLAHDLAKEIDAGYFPVLTHGTDTIGTTGVMLSLFFPQVAMVLTGAFHPPDAPESDASNFSDSLQLAEILLKDVSLPRVPYVMMNGNIYTGSSLVKLDIDFKLGRLGFKSHAGRVGEMVDGRIIWNPDFIADFENERKNNLKEWDSILQQVSRDLRTRQHRLGKVELAFVNSFTPESYLQSVLDRLEGGATDAVVFHGRIASHAPIVSRMQGYQQKHPVFAQDLHFPKGVGVYRLVCKIMTFLHYVPVHRLENLIHANLAGEIVLHQEDDRYLAPLVSGDFYSDSGVRRSFLMYYQNPEVFLRSLDSEIRRLEQAVQEGHRAELILEGSGNGHLYVGSHPPVLNHLQLAQKLGIKILLTTRVRDAIPNENYEVGRILSQSLPGLRRSELPGRELLESLSL